MMRALLFLTALIATLFIVAPRTVEAEEEGESSCVLVNGVYHCTRIDLEVRVPRPGAFYVINRSRLSLQDTNAPEDFTAEVIDSLELEPF